MICYAVIDTNVLMSALLSSRKDAATVQVVTRMISGEIVPVYSNAILEKYKAVLNLAKFGFSKVTVDYLLAAVEKFGLLVEPAASGVILPDMNDLPFYEVVLEKREEDAWLVTGNLKHFPKMPFIVTARQMLDILANRKP